MASGRLPWWVMLWMTVVSMKREMIRVESVSKASFITSNIPLGRTKLRRRDTPLGGMQHLSRLLQQGGPELRDDHRPLVEHLVRGEGEELVAALPGLAPARLRQLTCRKVPIVCGQPGVTP